MSHDARDVIEDLFNDAFNEHGPYGAGRDTPTQVAIGRVLNELKSNILATLSPDPVLLGEVRQALKSLPDDIEIFRSLRAAGQSNRAKMLAIDSLLQPARAALAKLPKLTGEEV